MNYRLFFPILIMLANPHNTQTAAVGITDILAFQSGLQRLHDQAIKINSGDLLAEIRARQGKTGGRALPESEVLLITYNRRKEDLDREFASIKKLEGAIQQTYEAFRDAAAKMHALSLTSTEKIELSTEQTKRASLEKTLYQQQEMLQFLKLKEPARSTALTAWEEDRRRVREKSLGAMAIKYEITQLEANQKTNAVKFLEEIIKDGEQKLKKFEDKITSLKAKEATYQAAAQEHRDAQETYKKLSIDAQKHITEYYTKLLNLISGLKDFSTKYPLLTLPPVLQKESIERLENNLREYLKYLQDTYGVKPPEEISAALMGHKSSLRPTGPIPTREPEESDSDEETWET